MPEGLISQQTRTNITISKTISGLLFIVGVISIGGSLVATGGIYLYKGIAAKNRDEIQKQVTELEQKLRTEGVNQQMLELDRKLSSARSVLEGHVASSNVFKLLEENTLLQVQFTTFAFTADARVVNLTGNAAGYSTVASQVRVFESLPEVQDVTFGGLQLSETGKLSFKMSLTLDPALLRWRNQ